MKMIEKVLICITFLMILPILITSCYSINVDKYKGDGALYTIGSSPVSYGYKIDFGGFDLSEKYNKKKMLQGYPKMEKEYMVGIYIESGSSTLDSDLDSYLSIKMDTYSGDTLFECSGNMSSWRWSRSTGDKKGSYKYFVYYMTNGNESGFSSSDIPADNSTLYLHVDYVPSGKQWDVEGFSTGSVLLKVGGYK
jgi:hypothetical protein